MLVWINKKKNKKGFTLIELVVVIAILGILAALALPRLTGVQRTASVNADVSVASTIVNSAKLYIAEENLTTDAEVNAVKITNLTGANLMDDPGNTKTTGKAFVLTVSNGVSNPTFTVTDGTDTILPRPASGTFAE